jgi:hypothetical protein
MNNSRKQLVTEWVTNNLKLVGDEGGVSIHIDQLLGRTVDKRDVLKVTNQAFTILVEEMNLMGFPAKPVMIIPLTVISNRYEGAIPRSPGEIKRQLGREPPGLYLIDWKSAKHFDDEYRTALSFNLTKKPIRGLKVYYREYRDPISHENDEEYSRDIYVEYVP